MQKVLDLHMVLPVMGIETFFKVLADVFVVSSWIDRKPPFARASKRRSFHGEISRRRQAAGIVRF